MHLPVQVRIIAMMAEMPRRGALYRRRESILWGYGEYFLIGNRAEVGPFPSVLAIAACGVISLLVLVAFFDILILL